MQAEFENGVSRHFGTASRFLSFFRALAGAQGGDERLREHALLSGHEPTGNAPPENPPLGAAELVGAVMNLFCEDLPGLSDAPVIHRESVAGPQGETEQI